jgi:cell division septum initiation protein DivIVA
MSIKEQEPPAFARALRGYDRAEVDEYVAWLRAQGVQAEDLAGRAESALAQCRRELASSPTTAGISQRLAAMLQLATEEAEEIRERARTDAEATTRGASDQAERTIDEATRQRDAIQREIDELSTIREQLLQRLIELGGEVVGATERFRGYAPGAAPRAGTTALYDVDADVDDIDEDADGPATEPSGPAGNGDGPTVSEP